MVKNNWNMENILQSYCHLLNKQFKKESVN